MSKLEQMVPFGAVWRRLGPFWRFLEQIRDFWVFLDNLLLASCEGAADCAEASVNKGGRSGSRSR